MGKVYILTPDRKAPRTGGQVYNQRLYSVVEERVKDIQFICDSEFPKAPTAMLYNVWYLRLLFIAKPDFIIFDSRMYPRLFLFLPIYRMFFFKTKWIATHHHFNFLGRKNKLLAAIDKKLELGVLKRCDEIIPASLFTESLTKKYVPNIPLSFLPNAVNKELVMTCKRSNSLTQNCLFIGTVYHRKGVHIFVDILKQLKAEDVVFHVVGTFDKKSPYVLQLEAEIAKTHLQDKIKFYGRLSTSELSDVISKCSLFTFPSLFEGYGLVLAEAMGYGLPVIAFNNSAIPFLVKDGENGLIVENLNATKFARAIDTVLEDEEFHESLVQGALKTFNSEVFDEAQQKSKMGDWVIKTLLN